MDARTARIAAGGGLAASLRESPAKESEARNGYRAAGSEPDGMDRIAPHAVESRVSASLSVPRPSVQTAPFPNENPN